MEANRTRLVVARDVAVMRIYILLPVSSRRLPGAPIKCLAMW
jgi:hypothetical protein